MNPFRSPKGLILREALIFSRVKKLEHWSLDSYLYDGVRRLLKRLDQTTPDSLTSQVGSVWISPSTTEQFHRSVQWYEKARTYLPGSFQIDAHYFDDEILAHYERYFFADEIFFVAGNFPEGQFQSIQHLPSTRQARK